MEGSFKELARETALILGVLVAIIAVVIFLIRINSWYFRKKTAVPDDHVFRMNIVSFIITFTGILTFILFLDSITEQGGNILTFFGILISAVIALSSTTVLGNLIAGMMNQSLSRFNVDDLIKLGEFQGRVINKGLLHTEVQLEDSNIVALPNLYIATQPLKLTRKKTVIHTSVSLGYDLPRTRIQELLKEAALASELKDPYVYVTELQDFSVVYKVHGFLEDSSVFFSSHSTLNCNVLDVLHKNRIEIVSPTFMNQRRVDDREFVPVQSTSKPSTKEEPAPEPEVFDESIQAKRIERIKKLIKVIDEHISGLKKRQKELKEGEGAEEIKKTIERWQERQEKIQQDLEDRLSKDC